MRIRNGIALVTGLLLAAISACAGPTAGNLPKVADSAIVDATSGKKTYKVQSTDLQGKPIELTVLAAESNKRPLSITEGGKTRPDDPFPEKNLVTHPIKGVKMDDGHLKRRRDDVLSHAGGQSDPIPPVNTGGTNYYGPFPSHVTPAYSGARVGLYASHQVQLGMELGSTSISDDQRVLYSPTMLAPNHCPLECVSAYVRYWNYGSTNRFIGIYNHERPRSTPWEAQIPMDSTFVSTYLRRYDNWQDRYWVEILSDANNGSGWTVYIYNYNTGVWDPKAHYNYTSATCCDPGWDYSEWYYGSNIPQVPATCAIELNQDNGSSLLPVTAAGGNGTVTGYNYTNGGMYMQWPRGVLDYTYWLSSNI